MFSHGDRGAVPLSEMETVQRALRGWRRDNAPPKNREGTEHLIRREGGMMRHSRGRRGGRAFPREEEIMSPLLGTPSPGNGEDGVPSPGDKWG